MLNDRERRRMAKLQYQIREGIVVPVMFEDLVKSSVRATGKDFESYKRDRKNANKMLKVRLQRGHTAMVYFNKQTKEVVA